MPARATEISLATYEDINDIPGVRGKTIRYSQALEKRIAKGKGGNWGLRLEVRSDYVYVTDANKRDFAWFRSHVEKISTSAGRGKGSYSLCSRRTPSPDLTCGNDGCDSHETCKIYLIGRGLKWQHFICKCQ